MGVTVNDTSMETKMATDKVTENSLNNLPTIPPIKRIGTKTAIKEILNDRMVKATC